MDVDGRSPIRTENIGQRTRSLALGRLLGHRDTVTAAAAAAARAPADQLFICIYSTSIEEICFGPSDGGPQGDGSSQYARSTSGIY